MTEATKGAVRAAKEIAKQAKMPGIMAGVFATIIDQETGLPELLEALEDLLKVYAKTLAEFECGEVWEHATRKHRAAIAKAKGD